jgi:hypothetical protein
MSQTIVPKSDQLNAEDLLSGPRTVTITEVRRGSAEQPVDIHLAEFDRPFKPSKTVRRILVVAWGANAASYVGRRMTLYRDPAVKFGGMDVGGIRISHLSHIDKRMTVALTVTRGKRAPYVVEPLAAPPARQLQPESTAGHEPAGAEPGITTVLSKRLYQRLKAAGHGEQNAALAYLSEALDRNVTSTKELTAAEAIQVIEGLERPVQQPVAEPTGGAEEPNPEVWLASQQPPDGVA